MDGDYDETRRGDSAGASLSMPSFFGRLYERSEGSEVDLGFAHFSEALLRIGRRFLPSEANDRQIIEFYQNLHLKDLALAQACSRGKTVAWERFQRRYRDRLYSAALVIARSDSIARELSDSLSGDLFGGQEGTSEIPSPKLTSYTGRGSLEGWLKAVLANAYVDRYRSQRRVLRLDDRLAAIGKACLFQPAEQDRAVQFRAEPDRAAQLFLAIEEACLQRQPDQRFLLAAYFCDGWNLAEIGRRIGVHESTVSRRLDRVLRELRKSIVANLRKHGISPRQIEEMLQADVQNLPFDIRRVLLRGASLAGE
jgi:RNA polymerase sigma-70 factor (ECF subfamily)